MKDNSHKDISYYCDKCGFLAAKREKLRSHMEAVYRDGDFSIKGGNLGVGKKISINILKTKSVEVFFCCIWLMYLKLNLIHSKLGKLFHMNFFVHFLKYLGAVHLSHDTWRGRGSQAKYHSLSQGKGGVFIQYITLTRDKEVKWLNSFLHLNIFNGILVNTWISWPC